MDRREFVRWLLALLAGLGLKWPRRVAATPAMSSKLSDSFKFGGEQDQCIVRIPGRPESILVKRLTVTTVVERMHGGLIVCKSCAVTFGHMIGPCDAMAEFFERYSRVENAAHNDLTAESKQNKWQLALKGVVITGIAQGIQAGGLYAAEGVTMICVNASTAAAAT